MPAPAAAVVGYDHHPCPLLRTTDINPKSATSAHYKPTPKFRRLELKAALIIYLDNLPGCEIHHAQMDAAASGPGASPNPHPPSPPLPCPCLNSQLLHNWLIQSEAFSKMFPGHGIKEHLISERMTMMSNDQFGSADP